MNGLPIGFDNSRRAFLSSGMPAPYPEVYQQFKPSPSFPYPMGFMEAKNPPTQVFVSYNGRPMLQGLNNIGGPVMIPLSDYPFPRPSERYRMGPQQGYIWGTPYPRTHSIPDPYQLGFIAAMPRNYR